VLIYIFVVKLLHITDDSSIEDISADGLFDAGGLEEISINWEAGRHFGMFLFIGGLPLVRNIRFGLDGRNFDF
jgi:hypothetical protein